MIDTSLSWGVVPNAVCSAKEGHFRERHKGPSFRSEKLDLPCILVSRFNMGRRLSGHPDLRPHNATPCSSLPATCTLYLLTYLPRADYAT